VAVTPHLDQLAREGTRYTRVFTTAGVCAPSRAALLTGVHAISTGSHHMRTSNRGYRSVPPPDVKAFPELLRAAGYATFTDFKLDYQFSGTSAGSDPFTIWDEEGFSAHRRKLGGDRPFFGLINFLETHESGVFPRPALPRSTAHAYMQIIHFFLHIGHDDVVNPEDVPLPPYYPDTPLVRADVARHYNNVHRMDERVGEILDQLRADGLSESTVVIWASDHGDGLPRAKRELFDSGIHVPMIIRWPPSMRPPDAEPRPEESLYDTWSDPHEVHDLAANPDYEPILEDLRGALDAWLAQRVDWGAVPEDQMIAEMWPGGEEPVTGEPIIEILGSEAAPRVRVSAATPGSSLGYRLDGGDWRLVTAPGALVC
jgi:arylsulfatase A-like enzyme